jgi:GTP-binding protein YchF
MEIEPEWRKYTEGLFLLTSKPLLYCANISENDLANTADNRYLKKLEDYANKEHAEVMVICARIEEEIIQLGDDEKGLFLSELGISESGLEQLIKKSYKLLGLISFLTAGEKEVRAWTIVKGTKAPQAAGKIHSDFERGFIRAEVISYDELIKAGSYNAAKEHGLVRSEGKEYVMKDGDVTLFRFNV